MSRLQGILDTSTLREGDTLPESQTDITAAKIIAGAAATRDWQPLHHDYAFATGKAGTPDIIMNSPTQAGWISKYITDWAGPLARIRRMRFKMKDAICPGQRLAMNGTLVSLQDQAEQGLHATIEVVLTGSGQFKTKATVEVVLPNAQLPNPWQAKFSA